MKKLYAPWRSKYTKAVTSVKDEVVGPEECVFCKQAKDTKDADHFILRRFIHNIIMLNLYPYNAGHILILPKEHYPDLHSMPQEARFELMELITATTTILKEELHAQGINVGLNLGKAAGAGIPSHVHMHVLPRWIGDTNFLPTIADTKQVSTDLHEIYEQLREPFSKIDVERL